MDLECFMEFKKELEALKSSTQWLKELNAIYEKTPTNCLAIGYAIGLWFYKNIGNVCLGSFTRHRPEQFIDELLYKKNIFIAPGAIFGSNGNGYVRFSLCASEKSINEAIKRTVWKMYML